MATFLDGIWGAVPTPFLPDGGLNLEGVRKNARHLGSGLRLDGIFCNGLMGEGWSMTAAERKSVLEAALDGTERVGVVVTHHSLAETIDLSRHAMHVGAHHIVLSPPPGLMSAEDHYRYVCEVTETVSVPVVLFDTAAVNGSFSADTLRRLGEERRVVAVKCTRDADSIIAVRAACGDSVMVCDPYEMHWLQNLARFDARTLYADPEPYLFQTSTAQPIREYFDAYKLGDVHTAWTIFRRLEPLRRLYEQWIIAPLRRGGAPNAALKHWCARLGLESGPVRRPLAPLLPGEQRQLDIALTEAFATVFGRNIPC